MAFPGQPPRYRSVCSYGRTLPLSSSGGGANTEDAWHGRAAVSCSSSRTSRSSLWPRAQPGRRAWLARCLGVWGGARVGYRVPAHAPVERDVRYVVTIHAVPAHVAALRVVDVDLRKPTAPAQWGGPHARQG